jgi:hypothetical protein
MIITPKGTRLAGNIIKACDGRIISKGYNIWDLRLWADLVYRRRPVLGYGTNLHVPEGAARALRHKHKTTDERIPYKRKLHCRRCT